MTVLTAAAGLALAACGSDPEHAGSRTDAPEEAVEETAEDTADGVTEGEDAEDTGTAPEETTGGEDEAAGTTAPEDDVLDGDDIPRGEGTPRPVVLHGEGVMVVDGETLEVLADLDAFWDSQFAPLGDGRSLLVLSRTDAQVLDTGAWARGRDASEPFLSDPVVTDVVGGISRAGQTALYPMQMDRAVVFNTPDLRLEEEPEPVTSFRLDSRHNGYAVPLGDGGILVTESDGDLSGIQRLVAVEADGSEAERGECPSRGAVAARTDAVVASCEGYLLIHRDREFSTIDPPDPEALVLTLVDHPRSPVVVGTYDDDLGEAYSPYLLLADTEAGTAQVVDTGSASHYRHTLARGPEGEVLALGRDGVLRVIDETTGETTDEIKVIDEVQTGPWNDDPEGVWPELFAAGPYAYVTDDRDDTLHKIDLAEGEVVDSTVLPHDPIGLDGVSGEGPVN